jgi:hypothetical protein
MDLGVLIHEEIEGKTTKNHIAIVIDAILELKT